MTKRICLEQSGSSFSLFSLEDFSALDEENKFQVLFNIIDSVCTLQLQSRLQQELQRHLCRDFLSLLPPEIAFKILGYLDVEDLLRGLQVCRKWRHLITEATPVWKTVTTKKHGHLPLSIYDILMRGTKHVFDPQARITWNKCAELPVGMIEPQTVVINDKVYVGGGVCDTIAQEHHVFSYSLSDDAWSSLPDCPMREFGMGQLEGRVVAIGGLRRFVYAITNEVYVLDEGSQSWKDSIIPPIITPRHSPAVLSYHSSGGALIVAGGVTPSGHAYTVELFRQDTSQWHRTCPLPFPCCAMSSVVIQNTAYLLGGAVSSENYSNRVVYASVDSLLQQSLPPDQTSKNSDFMWKTLPNIHCYASAAATINGCLLAIGGDHSSGGDSTPQKEVHIYSPSTASWLNVSDLPSPQLAFATAMISPTEFLVIGGVTYGYSHIRTVLKASLEIH